MKRLLIIPVLAIVGLLAAGCLVRFATVYEDSDGNDHYVALVTNFTGWDVVASSVQVDLYDSGNHFLATEFTNPCTRTLQHGQSAPIEVTLPAGVTVDADNVQTTVRWITIGTKSEPDLDVSDVSVDTSDDTTHITGSITNDGSTHLYAVQVCAVLLDDDDNVLRVGRVSTDPTDIDDDETADFDIAFESDDDATQYELWIDAVTHGPNDVTAPYVVGPEDIEETATATPEATSTATETPEATPTPTSTPGT